MAGQLKKLIRFGINILPAPIVFCRIVRLPRRERDSSSSDLEYLRWGALLSSLYGLNIPVVFRFEQHGGNVRMLVGIGHADNNASDYLRNLYGTLSNSFPGIEIDTPTLTPEDGNLSLACLVGTPNPISSGFPSPVLDLGSLASSLGSQDFGFSIVANPLHNSEITKLLNQANTWIHIFSSQLNQSQDVSYSRPVVTRAAHFDATNRAIQQIIDWSEILHDRYSVGSAAGLWAWHGILWTRDHHTLQQLAASIRGLFSGVGSLPEPLRVISLPGFRDCDDVISGRATVTYNERALSTLLPSGHLASLLRFPNESAPGLTTTPAVAFSTADISSLPARSISIGEVVDRGAPTGRALILDPDSLASHGIVAGMPGCGKTNACMIFLKELHRNHIPFLVIEPAKREYRSLLRDPNIGNSLLVFTLGTDSVSPFRLNPFEFPEGFEVTTHIDHLKSVFVSAFSMYGPMPQILEDAVIRVYQRRGWDLTSGLNRYEHQVERSLLFPTLQDLACEIDPVIQSIGYGKELTMDIRGALRTRIKGLLTGAKGLMLGAQRSTPLQDILETPTVLEISAMGDDQEKALIIGLLLVRLYEYRQVQAETEVCRGIVHLTFIEEAHRILKNVSTTQTNPEVSNVLGKSVDTFNNILAEIRAFGEGILIAEQIPSKLSPDAVKNTGLKIVMRMQAPDDRALMSDSMVLSQPQSQQLAHLPNFRGVVFGAGLQEAVMISMPPGKPEFDSGFQPVSTREIQSRMSVFHRTHARSFERFFACQDCSHKCRRPQEVIDACDNSDNNMFKSFRRVLLAWSLIQNASPAPMRFLFQDDFQRHCMAAHLCHDYFDQRAEYYRLTLYERVNLEHALMNAVMCMPNDSFETRVNAFLEMWRPVLVRARCATNNPCTECTNEVCYGFEMDAALRDDKNDAAYLAANTSNHNMRSFLRNIVVNIVGNVDDYLERRLTYCYVVRKCSEIREAGGHRLWERIMEE